MNKKTYVDPRPDPKGSFFAKINVSSTHSIGTILLDLVSNEQIQKDPVYSLILLTQQMHHDGSFESKHDNIARTAPELPENFIYRVFGHIGQSIREKNDETE